MMRLILIHLLSLLAIKSLAVCIPDSTTVPPSSSTVTPSSTLEAWVASQSAISENAMRRNIGSTSQTLIPRGVVVASPSTVRPDYYFQWIRDASIVMGHLVDQYVKDGSNLDYILDWIACQEVLQNVNNPSGGYSTGGLGEPKFNVDNSAFTGAWGRPQRDGPALRAITLIPFANKYKTINAAYVTSNLYSSTYPANTEEQNGMHYFTLAVSYRALRDGAIFANASGDTGAGAWYTKQADTMLPTLHSFWSSTKNYLVATLNSGRSGIDAGTLLGIIHAPTVYAPQSPESLTTVDALISSMTSLYTINTATSAPGVAIGRYPEDTYDGVGNSGGNPWFLTTCSVAHVLYRAVEGFKAVGNVTVTSVSNNLFKRIDPTTVPGTYSTASITGANLLAGMVALGDTFLEVVKLHAAMNGSLSEELSKDTGTMRGARDLTWSYEEVLGAFDARKAALGV